MIYTMNYADREPYLSFRKVNSWSAKHIGKADAVFEYSSIDICDDYKQKHQTIFDYKRGGGLWLWKPYLIAQTLKQINEGDWLLYTDSGSFFIRNIRHIISCAEKYNQSILLMEQPLLCRQFTKRECYELTGISEGGENQVLGSPLLINKCRDSQSFIQEWLFWCEQEELLSPKHFHPEIEEFSDFYSHREDQSLLTLLRIKHSLPVFRDCSDYGEFPFAYASSEYAYHPREYSNSNYPTVLLCNRKVNPLKYWGNYIIKHIYNSVFPSLFSKRYLK